MPAPPPLSDPAIVSATGMRGRGMDLFLFMKLQKSNKFDFWPGPSPTGGPLPVCRAFSLRQSCRRALRNPARTPEVRLRA